MKFIFQTSSLIRYRGPTIDTFLFQVIKIVFEGCREENVQNINKNKCIASWIISFTYKSATFLCREHDFVFQTSINDLLQEKDISVT